MIRFRPPRIALTCAALAAAVDAVAESDSWFTIPTG